MDWIADEVMDLLLVYDVQIADPVIGKVIDLRIIMRLGGLGEDCPLGDVDHLDKAAFSFAASA